MNLYFAYGSNLDEDQMKLRCPEYKIVGKAQLVGYKLDFTTFSKTRQCGCADIVASQKDTVWGIVYELSDKDLSSLDKKEGHPNFYVRIEVKVQTENQKIISVYTYEVVKKLEFQKPSKEYLGLLTKAAEKYNFPLQYQNYLKNFPTTS